MGGFDRGGISVVAPNHKQFEDLDIPETPITRRQKATAFYNELAEAYNEVKVQSILIVPLPAEMNFFNLKNILKGRDLKLNEDYRISRQDVDEDGAPLPRGARPAKLKKLTVQKMKIC